MKRINRRRHFALWIIVTAAIALTLWQAIAQRPAEPLNENLPDIVLSVAIEESTYNVT